MGGVGGGGLTNTSELTWLKLWVCWMNKTVSYGDDDLFQYLTFELLVLPLMLIIAVCVTLPQHVTAGLRPLS